MPEQSLEFPVHFSHFARSHRAAAATACVPRNIFFLFAAIAAVAFFVPSKVAAQAAAPRIDVAFVLDATSSMGPYIATARARIQEIAESLASGTPAPEVRFALVLYRDRTDDWTTQVHPFTRDIAEMQRHLDAASAEGGGDIPEAVLEGVDVALRQLQWSRGDGVMRLLYLVGDAPAQHYGPLSEEALARLALSRGVVLNAVLCGSMDASTRAQFGFLARHAEGRIADLSSGVDLGAAVRENAVAYGSALDIEFSAAAARPVSVSRFSLTPTDTPRALSAAHASSVHATNAATAETSSANPALASGLLGENVRWVRDAYTWTALWHAHQSIVPTARRSAPPTVDFTTHTLLIVGGQQGLEVSRVEADGQTRRAFVRPTPDVGVRFYVIANADPRSTP